MSIFRFHLIEVGCKCIPIVCPSRFIKLKLLLFQKVVIRVHAFRRTLCLRVTLWQLEEIVRAKISFYAFSKVLEWFVGQSRRSYRS